MFQKSVNLSMAFAELLEESVKKTKKVAEIERWIVKQGFNCDENVTSPTKSPLGHYFKKKVYLIPGPETRTLTPWARDTSHSEVVFGI